jgi:hypothetical protein
MNDTQKAQVAADIKAALNPEACDIPAPLDPAKLEGLTPEAKANVLRLHQEAEEKYSAYLLSKSGRNACTPAELTYLLQAALRQLRADGTIRS